MLGHKTLKTKYTCLENNDLTKIWYYLVISYMNYFGTLAQLRYSVNGKIKWNEC